MLCTFGYTTFICYGHFVKQRLEQRYDDSRPDKARVLCLLRRAALDVFCFAFQGFATVLLMVLFIRLFHLRECPAAQVAVGAQGASGCFVAHLGLAHRVLAGRAVDVFFFVLVVIATSFEFGGWIAVVSFFAAWSIFAVASVLELAAVAQMLFGANRRV